MKHLKRFNEEYTRTVGFRYSEPKIEMTMGINRDSDNDIQALSAFWGNLNTGKADDVLNDDPELVTIYVNGVKTNGVYSVNGGVILIEQYGYDIDTNDSLKVHYVKEY